MTNKFNEHSPLPWGQSHRIKDNGFYDTQVYTSDGEEIATLHWHEKPPEMKMIEGKVRKATGTYRAENAAFIVEACNSYYDLRERNAELVECLSLFTDKNREYDMDKIFSRISKAKQLIEKNGG